MNVLAERDNTILYFYPVYVLGYVVFFLVLGESVNLSDIVEFVGSALFCVLTLRFIMRLFVPKIILEYDDDFLYVNRRKKEPVAIAFKNMINISDVTERIDYISLFYLRRKFFWTLEDYKEYFSFLKILATTGILNLNYEGGYIRLQGIKNSEEVEKQLKRIISQKKKENIAVIEKQIAESRRQQELEELARHDINT